MNTSKSLDSILHNFAVALHPYANGKGQASDYDTYLTATRTAIVEAVEGLIGEDENTDKPYEEGGADIAYARNKLRAELRQAIKEWQNHGE